MLCNFKTHLIVDYYTVKLHGPVTFKIFLFF